RRRHGGRAVRGQVQGAGPRGEDRPHQSEDRRKPAGHAHPAHRMGSPQRGRARRAAGAETPPARAGLDQAGRPARFAEAREFPPASRSTTSFPPTNGHRRPLVVTARWWSRRSGGRQPLAGLRTPSRAFIRTLDAPSTGQNRRAGHLGSGWRRPERRRLHRRNPLAKRRGSSVRLWRKSASPDPAAASPAAAGARYGSAQERLKGDVQETARQRLVIASAIFVMAFAAVGPRMGFVSLLPDGAEPPQRGAARAGPIPSALAAI